MHDNTARFAITCSRGFPAWLAATGQCIAFTTYQAGKLFFLGLTSDGDLSVSERSFPRSMGLAVSEDGRRLALATEFQLQTFDDVLPAGVIDTEGYDARFAPHAAWVTGDLDTHDVAFGADGRPLFVNTLFGCLAAVSDKYSFRVVWKPPFISSLAAEDRCHLNGMATEDGLPRYATAVSQSDTANGWREERVGGGVVLDVASGEVVASGLSMPHSPRLHEGRLWIANSGMGEFGYVDLASGRFEPIAFCRGYARGVTIVDQHAVIGLSLARESESFAGLPLEENLKAREAEPYCGLAIIDLKSGQTDNWVRLHGIVRELYDVAALPDVRRPTLIGFRSDEVKRLISIEH